MAHVSAALAQDPLLGPGWLDLLPRQDPIWQAPSMPRSAHD
ncbi:hypothetical protein ACFV1W_34815 [Kitasatospora sp. NPDC059648]